MSDRFYVNNYLRDSYGWLSWGDLMSNGTYENSGPSSGNRFVYLNDCGHVCCFAYPTSGQRECCGCTTDKLHGDRPCSICRRRR